MSGCGRPNHLERYRRQLYRRTYDYGNCDDERLRVPGCVHKLKFENTCDVFGPVSDSEKNLISQKTFYLKFQNQDKFRMRTRRSDPNGVVRRYLNIFKINQNEKLIKDVSPTSTDTTFRNIEYFIEVWHRDNDNYSLMHYPNKSVQPTLRRSVEDLYGDPMQLPKNLGMDFHIRILAIGKPLKQRKIMPNFYIEIESRGYYPLFIALQENAPSDTQVASGTYKVLANGRSE